MPTVNASSNDGYVANSQTTWNAARAGATGSSVSSTATRSSYAINTARTAVRGGGYAFTVSRAFFQFDISGIESEVESATFKVYGYSQGGGDIIAVKATSDIATLNTADFDAITGWNAIGTNGSGGADMESAVTKYSDEIASWSTSGYNDITLTSDALSDMEDDDDLYICLINYDYDLKDIASTGYISHRTGLYWEDYTGTSTDPYIDYTLATVAVDNAVFFGTNF